MAQQTRRVWLQGDVEAFSCLILPFFLLDSRTIESAPQSPQSRSSEHPGFVLSESSCRHTLSEARRIFATVTTWSTLPSAQNRIDMIRLVLYAQSRLIRTTVIAFRVCISNAHKERCTFSAFSCLYFSRCLNAQLLRLTSIGRTCIDDDDCDFWFKSSV